MRSVNHMNYIDSNKQAAERTQKDRERERKSRSDRSKTKQTEIEFQLIF